MIGIYRLEGLVQEEDLCGIDETIGAQISIRSFYRAWNNCRIEDDEAWYEALTGSTRDIMLTWEPWCLDAVGDDPTCQPGFSLARIASGTYDQYIQDTAELLSKLPVQIYLRPMHEMNGNWYPWCGTVNGNKPSEYLQVWHHLRGIFNRFDNSNIKWVWSPYCASYPATEENDIFRYFPGDAMIDYIGVDGYNWGDEKEWSRWQNFDELFSDFYRSALTASSRDIIITETASAEGGGNKALWLDRLFNAIATDYSRIKGVVWFDVHKECDWRINSSEDALETFRMHASMIT